MLRKIWRLSALGLLAAAAALAATNKDAGETQTVVSGGGYFPVLIRLKTGELMAVLRGGAPHVGVKGRLDIVRSRDNGKTWSAPVAVVDGPEDDRNPAFGQLGDGTILLSYVILGGYDDTGLKLRDHQVIDGVYTIGSHDNGKTWTKPWRSDAIHEFYLGHGTVSPFGKMVQLADGTVLMAVYFEFTDSRGHQSYIYRSNDKGKTWGDRALMGEHSNETAILDLGGGHILAALRSEKGGHLSTASSTDGGRTWSPLTQITDDKEHPADLIRLKNGDVLLTYGERNPPFGVKAMLSHDGGKTWDKPGKVTLADDAASRDCGYPSSVQLPDGRIATMYYQVDDPKNTPTSAKARATVWRAPER